jgi:hypothetical protein
MSHSPPRFVTSLTKIVVQVFKTSTPVFPSKPQQLLFYNQQQYHSIPVSYHFHQQNIHIIWNTNYKQIHVLMRYYYYYHSSSGKVNRQQRVLHIYIIDTTLYITNVKKEKQERVHTQLRTYQK